MTTIQQAIKAALPHASKDKFVPILRTVALYGRNVIATDRYTVCRAQWDEGHDETHVIDVTDREPFLLSADGAKAVAKMGHIYGLILGEVSGVRTLTVTHDGGTSIFTDEATSIGGEYPPVYRFLEPFENWNWDLKREFDAHPAFCFKPAHLAKLSVTALKRDKRDAELGVRFMVSDAAPGKAIGFSFGDYVLGAMMPVRHTS